MNLTNLTLDFVDNGVLATYEIEKVQISESLPHVLLEVEDHLNKEVRPNYRGITSLRLRVRRNTPTGIPLYLYASPEEDHESLLEKVYRLEGRTHVIQNQESLLEDLMFGIIKDKSERIPYRMDCDTYIQYNVNNDIIDCMVMCNTVDFIVPSEWPGDFETLLEKLDDLLIKFGFTRGFGPTPKINPIRI